MDNLSKPRSLQARQACLIDVYSRALAGRAWRACREGENEADALPSSSPFPSPARRRGRGIMCPAGLNSTEESRGDGHPA